jgi:hypothetical protein
MKVAKIEIMKCKACGRLELCISHPTDGYGERLGGHKCAGAWEVVKTAEITSEHWRQYSKRQPVSEGDQRG